MGRANSPSSRSERTTSNLWCPSAIPAWGCPRSRRTRSSMRSLPRSFMGPAWDCPSAAPSWNRIAAACGLSTTLCGARVFTSFYPSKSRHMSDACGIITKASNHSVEQTVAKLTGLLHTKGITLFAQVDHSGEAAKVGMSMPPTKLLIFGNPKAGTPLMLAAPSVAIDLPLKILVWEDAQGRAWLSYNSPTYLAEQHGLPKALLPSIAVTEALASAAAE